MWRQIIYKFFKKIGINSNGYDVNDGINFENDKFPNIDNSVSHVGEANSVIEHIYNPNNFLNEIKKILKKNGNLIIVTPNFRFSFKEFYDDPTRSKPYTESLKILEMYEFENIKILPWLLKNLKFIGRYQKTFF